MNRRNRAWYLVAAAVVLFGIGLLQRELDPRSAQFLPKRQILTRGEVKETNLMLELPQQFLGLAMMGFREMAAGLLWVRADEFFHTGNYKAVMPLIRLTTWLDPRQLEVYATGAWHLDYNFTDSDERSDRRYIPSAIALLKEGIANNPDNYDLYFELAWTHYRQKIRNHDEAVVWAEKASKLPAIDPMTGKKMPPPGFIPRMLAHMYEKAGRIEDADRQWQRTLELYDSRKKENPKDQQIDLDIVVAKKNYDMFLMRRAWREVDTKPPIDVDFDVEVKKIGPRAFSVKGQANLIPASEYRDLVSESVTNYWRDKKPDELWRNGARVDLVLTDLDYDYFNMPESKSFNWEIDDSVTILVDSISIRDGKFESKFDLGRDRDIHSFTAEKYKLTLMIRPQEMPDFIQDRVGWHGEGMTDKRYLDRVTHPRHNVIKWEKIFDRDELI